VPADWDLDHHPGLHPDVCNRRGIASIWRQRARRRLPHCALDRWSADGVMRLFNYPGIDAVYTTMGIQPSRLVSRWRYTAACRSVSIVATTVLVGPSIPVEGPPPPHPAPRVRIASLGHPGSPLLPSGSILQRNSIWFANCNTFALSNHCSWRR
jgi:hypothetical protein